MQLQKIIMFMALGSLFAQSSMAQDKTCDELVGMAERLWLQDNYEQSNKVLEQAMRLCPDRAEVYWRKARNNYNIMEHIPRDKKPAKNILVDKYREMENLGKKCADLDPDQGSCYVWQAIGMGRRGTTQGVLNSLAEIKDMEGLLLKAIYLKPSYRAEGGRSNAMADACTALGQFYRVVPEWKFMEWLFGAKGDIEKSVKLQRIAVDLEPHRIEYVKELGLSLICRGTRRGSNADIEEGIKYLEKIAELPAIKPSDLIDKDHAKDLIAHPDMACAYQRDKQQDVSIETYKEKTRQEK
jgi:tetratricopeptide (TPR) repeat protein